MSYFKHYANSVNKIVILPEMKLMYFPYKLDSFFYVYKNIYFPPDLLYFSVML